MNREDVAKDLAVENNEVLRKEVQAAKLLLSECDEIFSEEGISNIELRGYLCGKLSADEVIELLASQQGEQATAAENSQVHPEQVEGAQGELDDRMRAAGMFTVAEMLKGTPLDAFTKHAGVCDMETFGQWLEMKRAEYLKMQARYDLGERDKSDDLYEWVIAHLAVFTEAHVNFRAALAQPSPVRYCHNAGSTAVNPGAPLPGCVGAQPYPPPELDDEYVPAGIVQAAIKDSQVDAVGLAAAALAPELEWPELVARLYTDINGDIHASVHATAGEPLIRLSDFDRIIGALRAEIAEIKGGMAYRNSLVGRLEAERDAAQARVAELQEQIEWFKNPKALAATIHADVEEAVRLQRLLMERFTDCRPPRDGLMGWAHAALSIPVAQAGQVPGCPDRGPWRVVSSGMRIDLQSDDFTHDVALTVTGDFAEGDKKRYAEQLAAWMNAAAPAQGE